MPLFWNSFFKNICPKNTSGNGTQMLFNSFSNNFASNQGLNVTPISSVNSFDLYNNYSFSQSSASSFSPSFNSFATYEPLINSYYQSSGYNSTSGYGLVNAAAAVATASGQNTFADVPSLGGNNWKDDLVKAPEAWAKGYTGQGVVVAVVDTGVDYNHEDLKDNIWTNPNPSSANDIHGWNFVDNNNNVMDNNGHGTHVSGIVAAENNNLGTTGVAYNAKIMPVKVLDSNGSGSYTNIAKGVDYAVDHGANVINLSLGGTSPDSTLETAIQYASSKNVVVVMAAGNSGSFQPGYPARYADNWGLSVGAVDSSNSMPDFSNRAGYSQLAYVTAPGVKVYSTIPNNQYAYYSGTSMAAPEVSGVVALMLSANHNLTDAQVRQIVTGTAGNATQTSLSNGYSYPITHTATNMLNISYPVENKLGTLNSNAISTPLDYSHAGEQNTSQVGMKTYFSDEQLDPNNILTDSGFQDFSW